MGSVPDPTPAPTHDHHLQWFPLYAP